LREEYERIKSAKADNDKKAAGGIKAFFSQGIYNEVEAAITRFEDELPPFSLDNPQCFLDLELESGERGRVVIELFKEKLPKTVENFMQFCIQGEGKLSYTGNVVHRVVEGRFMEAGDVQYKNGMGSVSIYGTKFPDEKLWLPLTQDGLLATVTEAPDSNNSQFMITLGPLPELTGKNTIFGRVVEGMEIVRVAEKVKTGAQDKPLVAIRIAESGQLGEEDKVKL